MDNLDSANMPATFDYEGDETSLPIMATGPAARRSGTATELVSLSCLEVTVTTMLPLFLACVQMDLMEMLGWQMQKESKTT